jgi:hypothetical protein
MDMDMVVEFLTQLELLRLQVTQLSRCLFHLEFLCLQVT